MYETQKKRRIRRPAAWLLAVLLTGVLCCQAVWADQRTLIPVGKAVGIKLFADGVLVVSTSETDPCPARDCGIREGDLIVSCNGEKVTSTEDLQALLQATRSQPPLGVLLWSMAHLSDSNLLYRGGEAGLAFAQNEAECILRLPQAQWEAELTALDAEMTRRNLSPGGSADLLALTLFFRSLDFWTELSV